MAKKTAANNKSSLLAISTDDTPLKNRRLSLRKKRLQPSPALGINSKRCQINANKNYESPLIHLGRANLRRNSCTSLDDSVVVLEEVTISHKPKLPKSFSVNTKQFNNCPDDSVIILSDNEEESKKRTNPVQTSCGIILDEDLSDPDSERTDIAIVTKIQRNKISSNTRRTVCKTKAKKTKAGTRRSLRKRKSTASKLQSISIDSEDENTIPNNDLSEPNLQSEIITVDISPGIEAGAGPPSVVNKNRRSTRTRISRFTDASPQRPTTQHGGFVGCSTADRLPSQSVPSVQKITNHNNCPAFCIDTKGDSNLHRLNARSKEVDKSRKSRKEKPNWAKFLKQGSATVQLINDHTILPYQPEFSGIGSYYSEETRVKRPGSLRDIVIDGCNIAMAYTNGKYFSEVGLKLVIDYFKLRGHTVKAFVPQHKRAMRHTMLEKLYADGIVVFTPSRLIGGRRISSYDDRYILDYATMCEGIVVSLDQYRDLYDEKPAWKNTIENHLLVPTFVGNCVMFPEDPLGRNGPKLEQFLRH